MHTHGGFFSVVTLAGLAFVGLAFVSGVILFTSTAPKPRALRDDTTGIATQRTVVVPTYERTNPTSTDTLSNLKEEWADFVKKDSKTSEVTTSEKRAVVGAATQTPAQPLPVIQPKTTELELVTLGTLNTSNRPYVAPGLAPKTAADPTDSIHAYGNVVGGTIQDSVKAMGDQNALLGAFFNDQTKSSAVIELTKKYERLAGDITQIEHLAGFAKNAAALAAGYAEVARGLRELSQSNKEGMYDSLLAYNKKVETFAEAFVPYASLFGAYGVSFSPDEPGGIFTPAVAKF